MMERTVYQRCAWPIQAARFFGIPISSSNHTAPRFVAWEEEMGNRKAGGGQEKALSTLTEGTKMAEMMKRRGSARGFQPHWD
jgi:hypothetical protein